MSVWKQGDCRTYRYDFRFKGRRHQGNTGKTTKAEAQKVERELRDAARLEAAKKNAGIAPTGAAATPRFTDWAAVYYEHAAKTLSRPDRVETNLRVVLRFWGAKPTGKNPKNPVVEGEPYHDLRLGDAIERPQLLADFEDWMTARGVSGQTKNQYRSTLRQMFRLAQQPVWRAKTGIQTNPMDGIYRDRTAGREVIITPEQLRAILAHASYHIRLAVAIGALAPELRLASILGLQWGVHLDADLRFITVQRHKTVATTRRPQVMPISAQLREILLDARRRSGAKTGQFVVTYRNRPLKQITDGVHGAARAAGVPYGRFTDDGVTFHTLRHTAATLFAEKDLSDAKLKEVMGWTSIATAQKYKHLRPFVKTAPIEMLSAALPIHDLVTASWRRPRRAAVGKPVEEQSRKLSAPDEEWRAQSDARNGAK